MVWSEQTQTAEFKSIHTDYGKFSIVLFSNGSSSVDGSDAGDGFKFDKVTLHGLFMWVSWTLFGLSMIATNRWFSYLSDKMQLAHSIQGFIILVGSVVSTVLMLQFKGLTFENLHDIVGWVNIVLLLLVSIGGVVSNLAK